MSSPTSPDFGELLARLARVLDQGGIPFMLIGGQAGVVRRKGPDLDWGYLDRWCREFASLPGRVRMPQLLEGLREEMS